MMREILDLLARRLWPLAVANLVVNIGIVVTGAAVRLTGSGLGCPTWPRCDATSYTTHEALGLHGIIEFGNRTLTFVLAVVALLCFLAALGAGHRRASQLSFVIGLYIPLQAIIGGVTVLTHLNPWVVSFHFLSSMAIIMVCVALLDELRSPSRAAAPGPHRMLALATFISGWIVLYLGTIVTGAGPHGGDEESPRIGLDPASVSHWHAIAAYALITLTVALLVLAVRTRMKWLVLVTSLVLVIEVLQGALGWIQYWLDLPVVLVALHMLGASLLAAGLARIALAVLPHHGDREAVADGHVQGEVATELG